MLEANHLNAFYSTLLYMDHFYIDLFALCGYITY
jgi:hypothetical protein